MSARVHVLGADPALARHVSPIDTAVSTALERIGRHLLVNHVDIVVQHNPFAVIPELGIGGFSPSGHLIHVSVDSTRTRFPALLDLHLSRTLAHELHHCARWRGPGYGKTLGEALVSEGLADHFDLQVHPDANPYHWTQALNEAELQEVIEQARSHLWDATYEHTYWFFNNSPDGPPHHAGYTLGFQLIQAYLNANPNHDLLTWLIHQRSRYSATRLPGPHFQAADDLYVW